MILVPLVHPVLRASLAAQGLLVSLGNQVLATRATRANQATRVVQGLRANQEAPVNRVHLVNRAHHHPHLRPLKSQ